MKLKIVRRRFPNGFYCSEEAAARAFAMVALPLTGADCMERLAVITSKKLYCRQAGHKHIKAYTFGRIYRGTHNNVVLPAILLCVAGLFKRSRNSYAHTHTNCACHQSDKFSRGFGDEWLAKAPGVENLYLASPATGNIYRYDKCSDPPESIIARQLPTSPKCGNKPI